MRVAAVDIGTNSVHLIVCELSPDGSFRVLDDHKEMVQLGRGQFGSRRIAPDAMTRALSALASFKRIAVGHDVSRVLAVATSAVREASNGGDFIREVARRTGLHVRVITGPEEGRLIYRAVRHHVEIGERRVLAIDIGGGSVELILGAGERALAVESLKLGHLRLADDLEGDPPSAASVAALRERCRSALAPVADALGRVPPELFVGTSGTIEAFARMDLASDGGGGEVHLHELEAQAVRRLTRKLLRADLGERRKTPGLDGRRAETIPAAGVVLEEILARFGAERLTVCTAALREGLVLDYLDRSLERIRREDALPDVRLRSANELLVRTQSDGAHAAHVSRLALQLYDDTAAEHRLPPELRQLLHVAALLHDVGLHLEHRRHHRHSQYLIRHGSLRGFTAREIEIVGCVARYHRKALPRQGHPGFGELRKRDQRAVRVLAALLRVADGLDRGHNQAVEAVHCQLGGGRGSFRVLTRHDAELELWGARRKADLFEAVFEVAADFQLERPDAVFDGRRDVDPAATSAGVPAG